jgi:hypothetical protein
MSLPAFAKHGVTRRCCLPLTERWHSGRTDWTSPAAALAGAGVIPGVARAAYQHRKAQFTTLSVDTPLPVGHPHQAEPPAGTLAGCEDLSVSQVLLRCGSFGVGRLSTDRV